jgi:hypothetical protein
MDLAREPAGGGIGAPNRGEHTPGNEQAPENRHTGRRQAVERGLAAWLRHVVFGPDDSRIERRSLLFSGWGGVDASHTWAWLCAHDVPTL